MSLCEFHPLCGRLRYYPAGTKAPVPFRQATIERAAEGQPALAWPPVQSGKTTGLLRMHNEDLAKFNRDGSTGQTYVSHLPGHSELYMIMPFKDLPQQ